MKQADTTLRLMRLIDEASDVDFHEEQLSETEASLRRIAAGLGAITLLLARQDEEMYTTWKPF